MPTYEYRRADGTTFEFFQRISDEPLKIDPETGQPVERLISGGAGLQFKGSGFYLTDYARSGSTPESSTSASESENGSSTESAKSEGDSNGSAEKSVKKTSDAD